MTQNAVKMIGHGTYEAIKGEENNENINPFVYGMLK